jgi:hypothetical protein
VKKKLRKEAKEGKDVEENKGRTGKWNYSRKTLKGGEVGGKEIGKE